MQLHGLHHVTAVTGNASENLHFYTKVLGLRLVKKTVNQDDVSAYHLFYADTLGSPGTDMTFFDWPHSGPNQETSDGIVRTMFRVNGKEALSYWVERFNAQGVKHHGIEEMHDRHAIRFFDPEGQQLSLVDDKGAPFHGKVWDKPDVPAEFAIRGFYAVLLAIPQMILLDGILQNVTHFTRAGEYVTADGLDEKVVIFTMDGGGPGKEVHVVERPGPRGWIGAGGVHHVAFRLNDKDEQNQWLAWLNQIRVPNSGIVDRFYFSSLYFNVSERILFELATDGPGFGADESIDELGERLSLPPFLEPRRETIEKDLKPLD